jgi:hypothetical protein
MTAAIPISTLSFSLARAAETFRCSYTHSSLVRARCQADNLIPARREPVPNCSRFTRHTRNRRTEPIAADNEFVKREWPQSG